MSKINHQELYQEHKLEHLQDVMSELGITVQLEQEELENIQNQNDNFFHLFVTVLFHGGVSPKEIETYAWKLEAN